MAQVTADAAMWTGTSNNRKTGDVPTLAIGRTREQSLDSCEGCRMRPKERGGNGECYSQNGGLVTKGHGSMIRAADRWDKLTPEEQAAIPLKKRRDYSLKTALQQSTRSAKMARFGSIGDPGALPLDYITKAIAAVRKAGLDPVGYTHHWRDKPELAGVFMASCDDLSEVDDALSQGFRAAVVLPWDHEGKFTTPGGAKGIVCPAMVKQGLTCNDCRLCDGSKRGPVIGFPNHGKHVQHLLRKRDKLKTKAKQLASNWLDKLDI